MHTLTPSAASIWLRQILLNYLYVDYTDLKLILILYQAVVQFTIGAHPGSPLVGKCEK